MIRKDSLLRAHLNVIAFAGTGKTTTLLEYTRAQRHKRFLYAAFNKSVRAEAEKKFPSNVSCKTCHSLVFSKFGGPHQHRLVKTLRPSTVRKLLSLANYMEAEIITET